MSDTATAPADTDLDGLDAEQLRERLLAAEERAQTADANARQVLEREAEWRATRAAMDTAGEDFDERLSAAIESGDTNTINDMLDTLDKIPIIPRKLTQGLRKHASEAAGIVIEQRRQEAEQARAQAILDAGAPPELAKAVGELLGATEPTEDAVSDVMERYGLSKLRDITGTLYDPAEQARFDAHERRRQLQSMGVPEAGIPLDQLQRVAAAEAAVTVGDKQSVADSIREKRALVDKARPR